MHFRMNRTYLQLALGLSLVLASHAATATYLRSDVNNNSSFAEAQSIESRFSPGVTATDTANGVNGSFIFNSSDPLWEWVSINAPRRDPASKDYYSFNVFSGQSYIFDIDTDDTKSILFCASWTPANPNLRKTTMRGRGNANPTPTWTPDQSAI